MKIGIKYCGGCNPRYDRKKLVDKVKKAVEGIHTFETAKEKNLYDFLLVVVGCKSCCADFERIHTKYGVVCIKSEKDYKRVIDLITKMNQ